MPEGPWDHLALGDEHACVVGMRGGAPCWGRDDLGQATPPEDGTWRWLGAGADLTCAADRHTGVAACWGDAAHLTATMNLPLSVVDPGAKEVCGLDAEGGIHCWSSTSHITTAPAISPA